MAALAEGGMTMRLSRQAALSAAILVSAVGLASASYASNYEIAILVSNGSDGATKDTRLRNAWGLAFLPGEDFWVNDAATGFSTIYDGNGLISGPAVTVPLPPKPRRPDIGRKSAPTGLVSNTGNNFFVDHDPFWPSRFIFASEDGTISGWWDGAGTMASIQIDNSLNGANCKPKPSASCQGAVYKGLALAKSKKHGNLLYATNFRSGKVEVYDDKWQPVDLGARAFRDTLIPAGYAPYGIFNLGGKLYVTYGKQDADKHDSVSCAGCGFVNIFDTDGGIVRRLIKAGSNTQLNAPWGVAIAPDDFYTGGAVLVGNFGDGRINAYTPTGSYLEALSDSATEMPLVIDGLWSIMFTGPNGPPNSDASKLYFTAGPFDESSGRFGTLSKGTD